MKAKAISAMIQTHKLSCITRRKGNFVCSCGRDAAEAELAAMQARIEKLDAIAEKLANIIQWAMDDEEDFIYSAEGIAAIAELNALKGEK